MRKIIRKGLAIGIILVLITVMFSMTVMNVNAQCQGKGTLGTDQALDVGNVQTRGEDGTFNINDGEIEYENGKPVIRLFTTTWCPHCTWIGDTFDQVVKEYIQKGQIIAYHWDVDIGDNTLTETVESEVPKAELEVFFTFNPQGSIPTFVFASKYWRIGNGYEWQNDLEAEEAEFRTIIENLINRKKINDVTLEDSINNVMPEYTNVNVKTANELISANKDVVILDIRPETEYESYHITNSLSLPYDKLESLFFTLNLNIEDTIIIYDKEGCLSEDACKFFVKWGYSNVHNMVGGMDAWIQAGFETIDTNGGNSNSDLEGITDENNGLNHESPSTLQNKDQEVQTSTEIGNMVLLIVIIVGIIIILLIIIFNIYISSKNKDADKNLKRKWLVLGTIIMLIAIVFAAGTMNMSADEEPEGLPFQTIWDEIEDIQEQIDDELEAREEADAALQAALNAEIQARMLRDNELEAAILVEEIARIADVGDLQDQIDALEIRIAVLEQQQPGTECTHLETRQCGSSDVGACEYGFETCINGYWTDICVGEVGPTDEICDEVDNDCDGEIDELWKSDGKYTLDTSCGNCYTDCTEIYDKPNAYGTCDSTGTPACVMICDPGYADLNGNPEDGCEFLDSSNVIYVSRFGGTDDSSCGLSTSTPCETINYGLTRAIASGRSEVHVASGLYVESITLVPGKSILGGYNPVGWAREPDVYVTRIRGDSSGLYKKTIEATGITSAQTIVDGFTIEGQDNYEPGGNSYAIYIKECNNNLVIRDNIIEAGDGGDGVNGGSGTSGTDGSAGGYGVDAFDIYVQYSTDTCTSSHHSPGGAGGAMTCGATSTNGGDGGNRVCPTWDDIEDETDPPVASEAGSDGLNGGGDGGYAGRDVRHQAFTCYAYEFFDGDPLEGGDGEDGINGVDGNGGTGGTGDGAIIASEWAAYSGTDGLVGTHGSGGGGGGSGAGASVAISCYSQGFLYDNIGGTGGGGGAGGCGGVGGSAGMGGGGSFGLFVVFSSTPTSVPVITNNDIYLGNAGDGGDGGNAGVGGSGGIGGFGGEGVESYGTTVDPAWPSFDGGKGGNGGGGGHGGGAGGGAGGISYGVYAYGQGSTDLSAWSSSNTFPASGSAGSGGSGGNSLGNPGGNGANGSQGNTNF